VAKVRPKHQRDLHGAHSGGLIDAENGLVSRRIFIEPEIYIEEVRFARDSPLEEGVMCELVSESPKFPASREKTGNLHRLALRGCQMMPNT